MTRITSQIKQWYLKTFPGMNTKLEEREAEGKYVARAQNCRLDEPGSVKKREPIAYFNSSTIGSGAVPSFFRYYTSGGVACWVTIHGTSAYVGDDSAGTFTAIRTGLTSGKRTDFVVYKDLLYASNGSDDIWVYDGASDNVTWEMGSCKAVTGSSTGITKTNVSYSVTYAIGGSDDAFTPGAASNEIASLSNEDVELSNIPLGPSGTTNRKIYRKDSSTGGSYKLVTTISDNTTTTYTDSTADVSGNAALPSVTDDMPKGTILKLHRERLFISGDPNSPNRIYYSNVNLPHIIRQTVNTDYMDVTPEDNDEIMGIPIQLGVMVCIKKNTIRKLHITSPISGADPSTWYADDPVSFTGTPARWSVTQTPYGVAFLGWDHWYVFNGMHTQDIIPEFDTTDILEADYSDTVAYWHAKKGVLVAGYTDAEIGLPYHNRIMRYNMRRKALSYDTVDANCFASKNGDDEAGELFYGDAQNGFVYSAEKTEIAYRLRTKSDCNDGTNGNTFVGGTEAEPYIEIGSTTTAESIPNKVCILWDQEDEVPGSGWTELTSTYEGKFIYISTTALSTGGGSTHTHDISGTLLKSTVAKHNCGDGGLPQVCQNNHTHTLSAAASDGETANTALPRYVSLRIFEKNGTTTEYEFPDGAIVMYDQPTAPTGWQEMDAVGYYLRIDDDTLNTPTHPTHSHDFSLTSGPALGEGGTTCNSAGNHKPQVNHTHPVSSSTLAVALDDWELDHAKFRLMKKVGETDTWDGTDKYVYSLVSYGSSDVSCTADSSTDTFTATAHGMSNNDRVRIGGTTVPTGITATTDYHVVNSAANTFQISATQGGAAVNFTSNGTAVTFTETPANGWVDASSTYDARYLKLGDDTPATGDKYETYNCVADNSDNDFTAAEHGLEDDDRVQIGGTTVPTGVTEGTNYWVINATTNTFQISETQSGSAVTFTDDGTAVTYTKNSSLHSHVILDFASDNATQKNGDDVGYHHLARYQHTHTVQATSTEEEANDPAYVSFRIFKKVLGKMKDYNAALESAGTYGVWRSPGIEVNAASLEEIFWNETVTGASDKVEIFTKTGSTQSDVEDGIACTADHTTETFTDTAHGMSNGDRISFSATTLPTGIDDYVYYIVNKTANTFQVSLTSGGSAVAFTSNGDTVTYLKWDGDSSSEGLTDPNGSTITSTANDWFAYCIQFVAADTTAANPQVNFSDGYVVKLTYYKAATAVESTVEFIYEIGFRNFNQPAVDKIHKKLVAVHEGVKGSYKIMWETENSNDEFVIDLTKNKARYNTFYQSTAMGTELDITFYKNDLYALTIKEVMGFYTPEPILV